MLQNWTEYFLLDKNVYFYKFLIFQNDSCVIKIQIQSLIN